MALLMAMAAIVRNYSTVGIFEHHSVLFVMTFGIAVSKITSRLLVSELLLWILRLLVEICTPKSFYFQKITSCWKSSPLW